MCHVCHLTVDEVQDIYLSQFQLTVLEIGLESTSLKSKRGNRYTVCYIDYLTKCVEAFVTPDQYALTIAKLLIGEIVTRHDELKELSSDRGAAFLSSHLQEVCCFMGIH